MSPPLPVAQPCTSPELGEEGGRGPGRGPRDGAAGGLQATVGALTAHKSQGGLGYEVGNLVSAVFLPNVTGDKSFLLPGPGSPPQSLL